MAQLFYLISFQQKIMMLIIFYLKLDMELIIPDLMLEMYYKLKNENHHLDENI